MTTYFAEPDGTGTGLSPVSRYTTTAFLANGTHCAPGNTLKLRSGNYRGAANMLIITSKNGSNGAPITISAEDETDPPFFDGEFLRQPCFVAGGSWIVVEGINAARSRRRPVGFTPPNSNYDGTVVGTKTNSTNIIFRRICAWDAEDSNTEIFGAHNCNFVLFEDCAGWGLARKTFQFSQGGDDVTARRCWGRWEGSTASGPKMVFAYAYNNYRALMENCIATWSGQLMPQNYEVLNYDGTPKVPPKPFTNYGVSESYGGFSMDRLDGDKRANSKILGCIAYQLGTERTPIARGVFSSNINNMEVRDFAAYIPNGPHPNGQTSFESFGLYNTTAGTGFPTSLVAANISTVGGLQSTLSTAWTASGIVEGSAAGIWDGSQAGARIWYRYVDGVLTTEPLWPWPMNERIKQAMVLSGRIDPAKGEPVDVNATMQQLFGAFPAPALVSITTGGRARGSVSSSGSARGIGKRLYRRGA